MLKYINITFSINNLKKFNCVKILIFLKKKIFKKFICKNNFKLFT